MNDNPVITVIRGACPGPRVAVIAGVHGDEPVGVVALERFLPSLKLKKGTLVAIIANPAALRAEVRYVDANLNRSLVPGVDASTNEGRLARVLMSELDRCEAALDLHAGMGGEPPFVICEPESFGIARRLPVGIVSTGWVKAEPGSTDEYMYRQGKPAVCVECGDRTEGEAMAGFAVECIKQFLACYGLLDADPLPERTQRVLAVRYPVFKRSEGFRFARRFRGFERLVPGEIIAWDGDATYRAPDYPASIIFPWEGAPVGTEAFLVAEG